MLGQMKSCSVQTEKFQTILKLLQGVYNNTNANMPLSKQITNISF